MSPAARILVIRHGETPSNAARIFQTPETSLSDRGVVQAECLAARLRQHSIGLVLASDLERAHQTARIVVAECGAPLELEPLPHERNFGDLRGRAYAD
ncbi:MAG: histidine phosphatase family protein, partial [Myxococcota bacterium]|nr:histidine phosphatase family protein [Myxococcota bacterium]